MKRKYVSPHVKFVPLSPSRHLCTASSTERVVNGGEGGDGDQNIGTDQPVTGEDSRIFDYNIWDDL